ncbi:MAG: VWA domain-containing protein [Vicinamibacteria bacterium]
MRPRFAAGLLGLASNLAWAQATTRGQPPVFAVQVESVLIDAFVTNGDRKVPGLTARDFVLKDNGVPQPFEVLPADSVPIRAILLFDTSSSMQGAKIDRLRTAAESFLDQLRAQDEVALVSFSDEIRWRTPLTGDRALVRRGIESLLARGSTSAFDALFAALVQPRSAQRTLVIVFSDGEDMTSWLGEKQIRGTVERSNALIHVVAALSEDFQSGFSNFRASDSAFIKAWRTLAEITGGSLIEVNSPDRITAAFTQIIDQMKDRYILSYTPGDEPTPGWHTLDLQLKGRRAKVRGRTGYWVGKR